MALRILFAGTPDFSVPALQALIDSPHQVLATLTQPDRPAGRGRKLQASAVKQCAVDSNIPVLQPTSLKDEAVQIQLQSYQADVMVVVAYGIILPQAVLDTPKYGCLNIHASLLPRWRGAAPIHRAIQAGDTQTGISIMQMDAGLDTGDILSETPVKISSTDTTGTLHDTLATLGAEALLQTLTLLERGGVSPQPQPEKGTSYAHKISKAEAKINWQDTSINIHNAIRAFNPYPVAHTLLDDTSYRIWQAHIGKTTEQKPAGTVIGFCADHLEIATGDGSICITRIQAPGKKAMSIQDFFNASHAIPVDAQFI